jgi:hypothetical protein
MVKHRPFGESQIGGQLRVRHRLRVARQVQHQLGEPLVPAIALVVRLQPGQGLVHHRPRTTLLIQSLGRNAIRRLGLVTMLGLQFIQAQPDPGRTSPRSLRMALGIGHKVFQTGQKKGPETAFVRNQAFENLSLRQPEEEILDEIARVFGCVPPRRR